MTVIRVAWESALPMREVLMTGASVAGKKVVSVGETNSVGVAHVQLEGGISMLVGMRFSEEAKKAMGFVAVVDRDMDVAAEKKAVLINDLSAMVFSALSVEQQMAGRKELQGMAQDKAVSEDWEVVIVEIEEQVVSNPGFLKKTWGEVQSVTSAVTSVLPSTHQATEAFGNVAKFIGRGLPGVKSGVAEAASKVVKAVGSMFPLKRTVKGGEPGDEVLKTQQHFPEDHKRPKSH